MFEWVFNLFIIIVAVFFAVVGTAEAILKLLEVDDETTKRNAEL